MSKFHLSRLTKKYGYTGGSYTDLMKKIIAVETENINKKIARRAQSKWNEIAERLSKTGTRINIPDVAEVIPSKGVFVNKATISGNLISDTLRDHMTKNLRQVLTDFQNSGQSIFTQRGITAGRINPALINDFKGRLNNVFENYTKKDPKYNAPSNVKAIATTEVRGTLSKIKSEYARAVDQSNQNVIVKKTWIHNDGLSKEPRENHKVMDGVTILRSERFKVPRTNSGYDFMNHPHDPNAPIDQVVSCNCDIDYRVETK